MASMGSNVIPSAKCTWSSRHLCLLHITWSLHPPSVDAPVDVHSRSCNFPLIHPREVLLAGHWVTAQPLFSCGVILPSLPLEVGLCRVGLAHVWLAMHDRHLYPRECQPLMWQEAGFGKGCMTVHIGPSLCRRGCLSQSDAPSHMLPLPTYPKSSSFP